MKPTIFRILKLLAFGKFLMSNHQYHRTEFVAYFCDTAFTKTEVYEGNIEQTWMYERVQKKEIPTNSPLLKN
jgi:hypothetical protein